MMIWSRWQLLLGVCFYYVTVLVVICDACVCKAHFMENKKEVMTVGLLQAAAAFSYETKQEALSAFTGFM